MSCLVVVGARLDGETVGVRCEGGRIAALGPEVSPAAGDETLDAGGAPLVPALVNGHGHAEMIRTGTTGRVLMRGGTVEGAAEIVSRAAERARRLGIG